LNDTAKKLTNNNSDNLFPWSNMTRKKVLDRYDIFPHIEDRMSMTAREWLNYHFTMQRNFTRYLGHTVLKTPFDWIVIGDIIQDTDPEVIIEIGSGHGGYTLWMAHLIDAMDKDTAIISIDLKDTASKNVHHKQIRWVVGDAVAPETIKQVETLRAGKRGMVIEDSDHKYHTTLAILQAYEKYVGVNQYFVVEDTIVEFLDLPPFPGPLRAVKEFMESHQDSFVIDRTREKYVFTHNPMGYLLRIKDAKGTQQSLPP
jgi:cephalosporin hydroxylase